MKPAETALMAFVAVFASASAVWAASGPGPLMNSGSRPIPGRPVPGRPIPTRPSPYDKAPSLTPSIKSSPAKEPYDYRYYGDADRGSAGCHWMAERAIATKNSNWWNRYRACKATKSK
jgi:hypothetical protein